MSAEQLHYVYKLYGRLSGRLLYVGMTNDLLRRIGEHKRKRDWWCYIGRIDFDEFPNEWSARIAENKLIRIEKPLYNEIFCPPPSDESEEFIMRRFTKVD